MEPPKDSSTAGKRAARMEILSAGRSAASLDHQWAAQMAAHLAEPMVCYWVALSAERKGETKVARWAVWWAASKV